MMPLHLLKIDMPNIVVPLLTTRSWNAKITTMATLTVNRMSKIALLKITISHMSVK